MKKILKYIILFLIFVPPYFLFYNITTKETNIEEKNMEKSPKKANSKPTQTKISHTGNKNGTPIIFSHGYGGTNEEVVAYQKNNPFSSQYIIDAEQHYIIAFDYPDVASKGLIISKQTNLGQNNDIQRLEEVIETIDQDNIIGFGVSRGAATLINLMGTRASKKISALVLEAPFASLDCLTIMLVSKTLQREIPNLETAKKLARDIFPYFDPDGIEPLKIIDKINSKIPIIIIHSKTDDLVSINESRKLYIKRKQQGVNNIYLVELESGHHANVLWGPDGQAYQNAIHAFYKEYGFPYDKELAKRVILKDFQPTVETVKQRNFE
jgi:predicted esterase